MADPYFKIAEDYEKLCAETVAGLCKHCVHRHDAHQMNCIECCPLKRAIEAWQTGKYKRLSA